MDNNFIGPIKETKVWIVLSAGEVDRMFVKYEDGIKHRDKLRRDHPNLDIKMRHAILEG